MKPLHRDDLPMDIVEELTKQFQELSPGSQVRFLGDAPDGQVPKKVQEIMEKLQQKFEHDLMMGLCTDCGKAMPNFDKIDDEGWMPAEGWCVFNGHDGELAAWQCPECNESEDGSPRAIML